jgi:hypothetical protein
MESATTFKTSSVATVGHLLQSSSPAGKGASRLVDLANSGTPAMEEYEQSYYGKTDRFIIRGSGEDERDDAIKRKHPDSRKRYVTLSLKATSPDLGQPRARRYLVPVERRPPGQTYWRPASGSEWYNGSQLRHVESGTFHAANGTSRRHVGMVPLTQELPSSKREVQPTSSYSRPSSLANYTSRRSPDWSRRFSSRHLMNNNLITSSSRGGRASTFISSPATRTTLFVPRDFVSPPSDGSSPSEVSPPTDSESPSETEGESAGKRPSSPNSPWHSVPSAQPTKRSKRIFEPLEGRFDKLDLLCSATLDLGPLQENPTGCSCPRSKCIALYCDW